MIRPVDTKVVTLPRHHDCICRVPGGREPPLLVVSRGRDRKAYESASMGIQTEDPLVKC